MDQLKAVLEWLKAQHFWVLIVLVMLIGLGSWYMASAKLSEEFQERKSAIDTEFNAVQRLSAQRLHPSPSVNSRQAEEIQQLAARVRELWELLYNRQREQALVWPEELSQRFRNFISDKSFGDNILDTFRGEYANYIKDTFPTLPAIVDAREIEDSRAGGALGGRGATRGTGRDGFGGGGRGAPVYGTTGDDEMLDDEHMVRWHDQLAVKQQLTWEGVPSSLEIWVTQEDLWVYKTLLRAIAETNKAAGSDRYSNAAVRDIHALEVGQPATQGSRAESRIYMPAQESAGRGAGRGGGLVDPGMGGRGTPGGGATDGGMQSPYDMIDGGRAAPGMGGGRGAGPGGDAVDPTTALLGYRYVDENGEPLAQPTQGEFQFGTEFKRLPVRLVLTLDQRWLPRLIVELANQPLQVEVEEVRIDPASGVTMGGGGSRGGGRSLGGGSRSLRGRSAFGGGSGEVEAFDREPHVRDQVVLKGVVYIFYPPDDTVLEVQGVGGQGGLASDM